MTAAFILTLSCPNRPGIVARVTAELYRWRGNILEAHQFDDIASGPRWCARPTSSSPQWGARR